MVLPLQWIINCYNIGQCDEYDDVTIFYNIFHMHDDVMIIKTYNSNAGLKDKKTKIIPVFERVPKTIDVTSGQTAILSCVVSYLGNCTVSENFMIYF